MSKFSKLLKNPIQFFRDSKFNPSRKENEYENFLDKTDNRRVAFGFRINNWKREIIKKQFPEYQWYFVPFKTSPRDIDKLIKSTKNKVFIIWGYKEKDGIVEFATKNKISLYRMEDGFVRSLGLGSEHEPGLSYVLDKTGVLYYDCRSKSDLEDILNNYSFQKDQQLLNEAKKCLTKFIESKISKYNHTINSERENIYEKYCNNLSGKKCILAIGQVEDDASIKYGCESELNNGALVWKARKDNPDAEIFFKPHPDVLADKRKIITPLEEIRRFAHIIEEDISITECLRNIDMVYTITSLAGFEAVLRDIPTVTLGCPFYSGWGLTIDLQNNERRKRKLSKIELFAGAYLLYPNYFEPFTYKRSNLYSNLEYIEIAKKHIDNTNKNSPLEQINTAYELFDNDKKTEAIELVNKLVNENKNDPEIYYNRALFYRYCGWYEEIVIEDILKAIDLSKKIPRSYLNRLINHLWEFEGVSNLMLELLKKKFEAEYIKKNSNDFLRYATAFAEAGYPSKAVNLYESANKIEDSNQLIDPKFTILGSNLYRFDSIKYYQFKKYNKEYENITNNFIQFENHLRNNKDSICIVGNSPCEIGLNNGSIIDSNNVVIRFNNYSTDSYFEKDYGTKCNVWIKAGSFKEVKRRDTTIYTHIIVSGSNHLSRTPNSNDMFQEFDNFEGRTLTYPPEIVYEVYKYIRRPPSAGLIMLYWLYKINGKLNPNSIFGFSFTDQKRGISTHYFEENKEGLYRHDWEAEEKFYKTMLD